MSNGDLDKEDFCVNRTAYPNWLFWVDDNPDPDLESKNLFTFNDPNYPLSNCEGDCDNDNREYPEV